MFNYPPTKGQNFTLCPFITALPILSDVNDRTNEKDEDAIHLTEDKSVLTRKRKENIGEDMYTKAINTVIK